MTLIQQYRQLLALTQIYILQNQPLRRSPSSFPLNPLPISSIPQKIQTLPLEKKEIPQSAEVPQAAPKACLTQPKELVKEQLPPIKPKENNTQIFQPFWERFPSLFPTYKLIEETPTLESLLSKEENPQFTILVASPSQEERLFIASLIRALKLQYGLLVQEVSIEEIEGAMGWEMWLSRNNRSLIFCPDTILEGRKELIKRHVMDPKTGLQFLGPAPFLLISSFQCYIHQPHLKKCLWQMIERAHKNYRFE